MKGNSRPTKLKTAKPAKGGEQPIPVAASVRPLPDKLANPNFPTALPITPLIDEIVELLRNHPVLVVAGETGSGKTTQLPKACLAAGIGNRGAIAHTQPRRLAARTVAARIAEELGVEVGAEVGYAVRFSERVSDATVVKVMTDGLLLNELQRDPWLRRYQCVIVDEAHERSLNVDFILGSLKQLLRRRDDLKVIVTSATIDVDAFAEHFDGAPVMRITGRGYPVETVYHPACDDVESGLVECLGTIARDAPVGRRDVLVFQSGEREIFDNARLLKRKFGERFEILPLYARLPVAEQQRIFAPGGRQRVVLATNVAETSITVPNIGYVVDPGLARISRYSYRAKLQRLPVEAISQASAAQRAGRCGRVAPGVCYRLYGEDDFQGRAAYTDPELKRSNLAAVVLAMRAFQLGDIEAFPFIDPPEPRAVRDAVHLLHELQALRDGELTEIGRAMARLPVDPRLARMVIEASRVGALAEALIVVSALAAQDPRLRPLDRRDAADRAHAAFEAGQGPPGSAIEAAGSDFLTFVRLWHWLATRRAETTRNGFRRVLEKHFLSPARVREWRELHRQLLLACRNLGMKVNARPADYAALHRALLTGSLGFIGIRREADGAGARNGKVKPKRRADYDGARGLRFRLFPGSALGRAPPKWVFAAEISDIGGGAQPLARYVAAIEPEWIEAAARHLTRSTYSEPRWEARRGEAIVDERVTVYGLTVVDKRPKRAVEVDPEAARELFVREALVVRHRAGRGRSVKAAFLDHNERLMRRLEAHQARRRRGDLLVGERARADFYLQRLPRQVCSVATWERFAARASKADLARFEMTEAELRATTIAEVGADDFPGQLAVGDFTAPLSYKFAPGAPDDGVTVRVDLAALERLGADALDWLVPGFLEEQCLALVRGLPKTLRRQLAPVSDRVRAILPELRATSSYRRGKLSTALSAALRRGFGVHVAVADWRLEALPAHLRMNVQVRGKHRQVMDQDRDLNALRGRLAARLEQALTDGSLDVHERRDITEFPDQGVPPRLTVQGRGGRAVVYPVLVDRGDSVDLLVHPTPKRQAALNRGGYTRLALLATPDVARRLRSEVERDTPLGLHCVALGGLAELADALLRAAAWFAYFEDRDLPTTEAAFKERLASGRAALAPIFIDTLEQTRSILARRFEVAAAISAMASPAFAASRADLMRQLDDLIGAEFLITTPRHRLADLPRYLDAMAYRIDNLAGRVDRDQARMEAVGVWESRLAALREAGETSAAEQLRFLVQEFRVATFSQRLGTRDKVSAKRLQARFEAAESAAGLR